MVEIAEGLLHEIDVSVYSNPKINFYKMRSIRLELEGG